MIKTILYLVLFILLSCQIVFADGEIYETEMIKAANEQLKKNYDEKYLKGSLRLEKMRKFEDKKVGNIIAAVATYKTKKGPFVKITHTEILYYEPGNNKMVDLKEFNSSENLSEFNKEYGELTGQEIHAGMIYFFLSFVVTIPILLMFCWEKYQYSSTKYKRNTTYWA